MRRFISIISVVICSCKNKSTSLPFSKVDTVSPPSVVGKIYRVTGPIAVEAFFYRDFLLTANSKDATIDSAEMFIENNRQRYYDIMDSYGYYTAVGKKLLDILKVHAVTADQSYTAIQFNTGAINYTIDLNRFKSRSGVFLFNGKDFPIFWESTDRDGLWNYSVNNYFK